MKEQINKIFNNENNQITIILTISMMLILIFKEFISTYISSIVTLIPSVVVAVWFAVSFLKGKIKIKLYDVFFALMLVVGTISGLLHHQKLIAIIYQIKALGIYYLLFMIIRSIPFKAEQIKKMLHILNGITIVLVIFSIIEVIFQKNYLFPSQWAGEIVYADNFIRAYSLICNPNVYAFFLLFVLLYNYRFGNANFSIKNIMLYTLIFTGVFLSISRSALICFIGIITLYILKNLKDIFQKKATWNNFKLISIVGICCLVLTLGSYKTNALYRSNIDDEKSPVVDKDDDKKPTGPNMQDMVNGETFFSRLLAMCNSEFLTASLQNGRLAIVNYGIDRMKNDVLIGTGFSSFLTASNFLNPDEEAKKRGLEYADNQYIAILVESGLLGFIFIGIAFILLLKEQWKKKKMISIISSLIFAFFGLFINVLEVQLIAYIYFLFIACDREELCNEI